MTYVNTLKPIQKDNLDLVTEGLKTNIKNPYAIAAILAIVGKESGFNTKEEIGYGGTSNEQIRKIFGKRVSDLNDLQLTELKKDNYKFFEKVYGLNSGAPLGNNIAGDGFKYIGRGFNQLTGKSNYKFYGDKIGVDLVNNPKLLNDPYVAAKVLSMYFRIQMASNASKIKEYGAENIEGFNSLDDAVNAMYHANAGWGKTKQQIEADPTGGLEKARSYAPDLYEYIGGEKKNSIMTLLAVILLFALLFYFFVYKR